MKRMLAAIVVVSACAPPTQTVRVDGTWQQLTSNAAVEARLGSLRERAAADLDCPTIHVDEVAPPADTGWSSWSMFRIAGCDRRALYVAITCMLAWGRSELHFVPISMPISDAGRYAGPSCDGDRIVALAASQSELNAAGARDLDCPREDVIPSFTSAGPRATPIGVADGCGRRATYLPGGLRLASIVDVR